MVFVTGHLPLDFWKMEGRWFWSCWLFDAANAFRAFPLTLAHESTGASIVRPFSKSTGTRQHIFLRYRITVEDNGSLKSVVGLSLTNTSSICGVDFLRGGIMLYLFRVALFWLRYAVCLCIQILVNIVCDSVSSIGFNFSFFHCLESSENSCLYWGVVLRFF